MCTLMKQIYCTTRFLKAANHFACDRVLNLSIFISRNEKRKKRTPNLGSIHDGYVPLANCKLHLSPHLQSQVSHFFLSR